MLIIAAIVLLIGLLVIIAFRAIDLAHLVGVSTGVLEEALNTRGEKPAPTPRKPAPTGDEVTLMRARGTRALVRLTRRENKEQRLRQATARWHQLGLVRRPWNER